MDDVRTPVPGPGHNSPPPPAPLSPDQIRGWLGFELAPLIERRDVMVSALQSALDAAPTIDTDEQAEAFADNLRMAKAVTKTAEARRKDVKAPFLDGGREIDRWFTAQMNGLDGLIRQAEDRLSARLARIARERREAAEREAARLKAEAEAAAAAATRAIFSDEPGEGEDAGAVTQAITDAQAAASRADAAQQVAQGPAAEHVRSTTSLGTVATAQERLQIDVTDPDKVPRDLCQPDLGRIRDAVKAMSDTSEKKAALRRQIEAGEQPVPGVTLSITTRALIR